MDQTVPLRADDLAHSFTDEIEAVNADGDVFGSDRIDAAEGPPPPSGNN